MGLDKKLKHAYIRLQQRYNIIYAFDDVVNGILESIHNHEYFEVSYNKDTDRLIGLTCYNECLLKFVYHIGTQYIITFLPITKKDRRLLHKHNKKVTKENLKKKKNVYYVCKKCGYQNQNNPKNCWRCGTPLILKAIKIIGKS